MTPERAEDELDHGLRLLEGLAPEFDGGLSDHGPMVADALVRLGRPLEVVPWVCRYAERLPPASEHTSALRAVLAASIERNGWQATLRDRLPLLLPGVVASAFHAPIRVAHAAASLGRRDSPARRSELASALACWVESRCPLGEPPTLRRGRAPRALLGQLPETNPPDTLDLIVQRAAFAAAEPGFAAAISGAELPADPTSALHALAHLGRDLLLEQPRAPIVYTHLVTGPQAIASLIPWLGAADAELALAYTWQAVAAIHAAYRRPLVPSSPPGEHEPISLVDRAVGGGDEHAIKLVLACRIGFARDADPLWWEAASRLL